MKARDIDLYRSVKYRNRYGIVVCNRLKQGDEAVIIEWNDNYTIQSMNVNDLEIIPVGFHGNGWTDSNGPIAQ